MAQIFRYFRIESRNINCPNNNIIQALFQLTPFDSILKSLFNVVIMPRNGDQTDNCEQFCFSYFTP